MNISYFSTFLTVIDAGNFSAAAKQLNISQPAVSFQMQALEKFLGAPVFSRAGHELKLTSEGAAALPHIRALVNETEALQAAMAELRSTISGSLVISASTIPGEYVAPRMMASFRQMYPQVNISLKVGDSATAAEDVLAGRADIGFVGSLPAKAPKTLLAVKVADDSLVVIAQPGHEIKNKTIHLADLAGLPLIIREAGSGSRRTFEDALAKAGLDLADLDVTMEVGNNQAIISAVENGMGISVLSSLAVEQAVARKSVVVLKTPDLQLDRPLYLIFDTAKRQSKAAAAFIDLA